MDYKIDINRFTLIEYLHLLELIQNRGLKEMDINGDNY